jgi:hypothetical protein
MHASPDNTPEIDTTELLRKQLLGSFGLGPSAELCCRFEKSALPKEIAERIISTFRKEGWTVQIGAAGSQVEFTFSNPPFGALSLSETQSKQLGALLGRMRRFVAQGLPGGSRSYPLVETIPFRVLSAALHLLRADGLEATLLLGQRATPKAVMFSVASKGLASEDFPSRQG